LLENENLQITTHKEILQKQLSGMTELNVSEAQSPSEDLIQISYTHDQ
jgi:hypothetical protein